MTVSAHDWFEALRRSYENPPVYHRGRPLPGFPSDEVQASTTGQAGIGALREAFGFYQTCSDEFARLKRPIRETDSLLDFGTGWGRILRCFLRDTTMENLFGVDVSAEFIRICQMSFRSNNFITVTPFPPTPIPDARFNFIVGYSVFSHLSEAACLAWMNEFSRILAPGGLVALTTRSRAFFDVCRGLKDDGRAGYSSALARMFEDFDGACARYDGGEFVHSNIEGLTGGGAMDGSFYGETFIPEAYARRAYAAIFTLERFVVTPPDAVQTVMIFRKR